MLTTLSLLVALCIPQSFSIVAWSGDVAGTDDASLFPALTQEAPEDGWLV